MRVVVGWIASCHKLSLERMDDLHLALETLLAEKAAEEKSKAGTKEEKSEPSSEKKK